MERVDVAVIGAGAAGLAAAEALRRGGFGVAVFEARDRIGGRVLTHRDERVPLPIELGAEFIHGEAPETSRLLRQAGLLACDVAGEQRRAQRGKIRPAGDYWRKINRVLGRIDAEGPDQSFSDFLAKRPGGRSLARDRSAARDFVRGYHAADLDEIGVLSIAPKKGEAPSESAARAARVVQGYDQLPRWLARDLGESLHLRTPVIEIAWRRGEVELTLRPLSGTIGATGATSRVQARAVIITLPLGVLRAPADEPGGVRFLPDPPCIRQALDRLAMGSVIRLAVCFDDFPWRDLKAKGLGRLSFLQTAGSPFNVWWTVYPLRWPLAVAWSGGPPAADLNRRGQDEIADTALRTLAAALGIPRRRVESRVVATWRHDWDSDPLARGAYSYARAGGSEAAKALARPVAGTLFFAGEATDVEGRTGTVEGALASGLRAARQVGRVLNRRRS